MFFINLFFVKTIGIKQELKNNNYEYTYYTKIKVNITVNQL